jgi:cytochrome P450
MVTSNKPGLLTSLKFPKDTSKFIHENFHFGSFYKLKIPFITLYVVTDPNVAQYILSHNESNYEKSKIYWKELRKVIGESLGTVEGNKWLQFKKIHNKSFNPAAAQNYFDPIQYYIKEYMDKWAKTGVIEDITEGFANLNISIVMDSVFGTKELERTQEIAANLAKGESIIAYRSKSPLSPLLASLNGKNKEAKGYVQFFDKLSKKAINENVAQPEVQNLMNNLISESSLKGKDTISLDIIRNEMIVYLGASSETAGVAEAWTTYLLHEHPEYLKKVIKEIDSLNCDGIRYSDLEKLPYTTWAVKESLRLYPPSHGLIRDALNADMIKGEKVKKGDTFYISTYGIHRNPMNWDNPNDFKPERFANEENIKPYHFLPFGAGKHTCIGRFVALPMIIMTVAELFRRFEVKIETKKPLRAVSISTLKPNQPIKTILIPRTK